MEPEETTEETQPSFGRGLVKFVAGQSVNFVVASLIKNQVPTNNRLQEVELFVGAYVLSNMMRDKAIDWADDKLDEAVVKYREVSQKIKEHKEDTPEE